MSQAQQLAGAHRCAAHLRLHGATGEFPSFTICDGNTAEIRLLHLNAWYPVVVAGGYITNVIRYGGKLKDVNVGTSGVRYDSRYTVDATRAVGSLQRMN